MFRDKSKDGTTRLTGGDLPVPAAESGFAFTTTNPTTSTSTTPVTLVTFTIPRAGKWVISFNARCYIRATGQWGVFGLFNGLGAIVPNSQTMGFQGTALGQQSGSSRTMIVTTTGAETFTVRVWSGGAYSVDWYSDTSGYNSVTWFEFTGTQGPQGIQGDKGPPATDPRPWRQSVTYAVGDLVGYAGRVYRCSVANTGKPPYLVNTNWVLVAGNNADGWSMADPYFEGDAITQNWQFFWTTGLSVCTTTTTAGEFETGKQALKITLSPSSSQRIYEYEENIVKGGEYINADVRMKVLSGSVNLDGSHFQNDLTGPPEPFGSGAVSTAGLQGTQTVVPADGWVTRRVTVPMQNAKPRARATFIFTNVSASVGAVVVVDYIKVERRSQDTGWITVGSGGGAPAYKTNMADANSGANYKTRFRKRNGMVTVVIAVNKTGSTSPIFDLPAGYWPKVPVFFTCEIGVATSTYTGGQVNPDGTVVWSAAGAPNTAYYGSLSFPVD